MGVPRDREKTVALKNAHRKEHTKAEEIRKILEFKNTIVKQTKNNGKFGR